MNAIEKANAVKARIINSYGPSLDACTITLRDEGFVVEAMFKPGARDRKGKALTHMKLPVSLLDP